MTRRHYASRAILIVWPNGTVIGSMVFAGGQWFGPFLDSRGWAFWADQKWATA